MNSRKRQPISTGSEWSFELIQAYDREIGRLAAGFGLDTYANQIEVITAEQMMDAYASVGMPIGYHHWSYGKHFLATEKGYTRGRWAWPTRSSSTPTRASPTSWKRTPCACRPW